MRGIAIAFALFIGGCATLPAIVETRIQRVESMASLDQLADELGVDGWAMVDVVPLGGSWSFIGVFQRSTPRWNLALLKQRGLRAPP